ncbi:MAG TPA: hypothetical protein VGF47_04355, partial [Solirubrobacteraceae bacterium]
MSLRRRIAAVGGVAVALAVLVAAVAIYLAVRSDLRGQIDQSLTQRAQEFLGLPQQRDGGGPAPDGKLSSGSASKAGAEAGRVTSTGQAGTGKGGGAAGAPNVVVLGAVPPALRARIAGRGQLPRFVQPGRFGGAAGYVQFVTAKGSVDVPGGQGSTPEIPLDARDRQVAAS